MKLRRILLGLVAAASLTGCRTTSTSSSAPKDAMNGGYIFVGCAPSASECKNSCPQRDGKGEMNAELCPDSQVNFACVCPTDTAGSPTPPPAATHDFIGCLPSASECRYSCPSRNIITFQGSDKCERFDFACYCERFSPGE